MKISHMRFLAVLLAMITCKFNQFLRVSVLSLCVVCLWNGVGIASEIGSGQYESPLTGPATLSGDIEIALSRNDITAVFAMGDSSAITGDVRRLGIVTGAPRSYGLFAASGTIDLTSLEETTIATTGDYAFGIAAAGVGASLAFRGPLSVETSGYASHAIIVQGTADWMEGVDLSGATTALLTSGEGAYGAYVFDGLLALGNTSVTTVAPESHGLYALAGKIALLGPASINVDDTSNALMVTGNAPYSNSLITTRTDSNAPNPQKLLIDGNIAAYGAGNEITLDLAAGSTLNSRVKASPASSSTNAGNNVTFSFYDASARWNTGYDSQVASGSTLRLTFVNGGVWGFPVIDASNTALPTPLAPLWIEKGGSLIYEGNGTLELLPSTSLSAGKSARFSLIQADGGVPAGLEAIPLTVSSKLYSAKELLAETVNTLPALTVSLTRLPTASALPELTPELGELLPDGTGTNPPDDGAGSPFLALALSSRLNPLGTSALTSAIEGAPSLARALPVSSITRNLENRMRSLSPSGKLKGASHPNIWHATDGTGPDAFPWRVWLAPLTLHEQERVPLQGNLSTKYETHLGGAIAGIDRRFDGVFGGALTFGAGFSAGGGHARTINDAFFPTRADIRYAGGLLYGLWDKEAWNLSLEASILHMDSDLRQENPVMPLSSKVGVDAFTLAAQLSREFRWQSLRLVPSAGIEYSAIRQHGHTVDADLLGGGRVELFRNASFTQNLLRLPVGLSISRTFALDNEKNAWELRPEIHMRYLPTLGNNRSSLHIWRSDAQNIATSLGGPAYDRNTFEAGAALEARSGHLRLRIDYTWQGSAHRDAHLFSGVIGCSF